MTETRPPRFAEMLLESFGADAEFSDAVLGDLAQEYALRLDRYGERAARMWYHRQALITAPHLLRRWWSVARFADMRHLLNVAGLAYLSAIMIAAGIGFAVAAATPTFLHWSGVETIPFAVVRAGIYTMAFLTPMTAGFFAATYEEKRPMLAAIALAAAWTGLILGGAVLSVLFHDPAHTYPLIPPTWARIVLIPVIATSIVVGGAIRVRKVSALPAAGGSSLPS